MPPVADESLEPAVQAEFGVDRATASLPYTLAMIGFGAGGVVMGRMADRFGIMVPALIGAVSLSVGYVAAAEAGSLWQFALIHGVLIAAGKGRHQVVCALLREQDRLPQ